MPIMKIFCRCSSMRARMKSSVVMLKSVKVMMNVPNATEVTMKVKWLCCPVCHQWYHEDCFLMNNLSHLVLLLDYINRLY